jgi:V8-like Glu-specific endopeptidase
MSYGKLRLDGDEVKRLTDLLNEAFLPQRFAQFLLTRLNRRVYNYSALDDDYWTVQYKVILAANAELWWRDLLRQARNAVPDDPGLLELAEQMAESPVVAAASRPGTSLGGRELELKIRDAESSFDIATWRRRLGQIETRVCRIELPAATARGTGFLVGPNVVLTNYHVIEDLHQGNANPRQVAVRFDYKVLGDGLSVNAGKAYALAADWLIDHSVYSQHDFEVRPAAEPRPDELDYALLRIAGRPGDDPVGGDTPDPQPTPRRWIEAPAQAHDFTRKALYIVQHPEGKPMQVTLDSEAVLGQNANRTRVRYTTETEPGSSGSPCFGADWQWVALHHSGDPKYWRGQRPEFNQGIPVAALRDLLAARRSYVLGEGV